MDAGAAAVLAATVAGLASAIGVTASALITGRTAVAQAATTSRTEREKIAAERARHAFEARWEGYANFHVVLGTAVQKIIALAEGAGTLAADTTPTAHETRNAVREARMSLHKDVLLLGNTNVAVTAQAALQELESAFRAASGLAVLHNGEENSARLVWDDRYAFLQDRLGELSSTMGKVLFDDRSW